MKNYVFFLFSRLIKHSLYLNLLNDVDTAEEEIYLAHGSFMISNFTSIKKSNCLKNQYSFEGSFDLSCFQEMGLSITYVPTLVVHHNENSSTGLASFDKFRIWKQSYKVYRNFL